MRVLLAISALVLGIACTFPQEPRGQADRGSTIRTHTELVLVPVVVTDSSGTPVTGLVKEAFAVEEDGKPRTLALFEETKSTKPASSPANTPAGVYRNFLQRDEHSHIMIVVIDSINTPWLRQTQAKEVLAESLLRMSQGGERIGLFSLTTTGLRQLHPFTTDTKVLTQTLERLKVSANSKEGWADASDSPFVDQRTITRQTLSAMSAVGASLGGQPRAQDNHLGYRWVPLHY